MVFLTVNRRGNRIMLLIYPGRREMLQSKQASIRRRPIGHTTGGKWGSVESHSFRVDGGGRLWQLVALVPFGISTVLWQSMQSGVP